MFSTACTYKSRLIPNDMEDVHPNEQSSMVLGKSLTTAKRSRSRSESPEDYGDPSKTTMYDLNGPEDDAETYGASRFGNWGEYKRRKRAKLQIQNSIMEDSSGGKGEIFRGLSIYVRTSLAHSGFPVDAVEDQWVDETVRTGATETHHPAWRHISTLP